MTYEYACTACANAWEAEQSISAPPLTDCPSCHQATAKRQVSGGAGFILKGGGWYADGYGNQKSASPKDEGKSESTSKDAKPSESTSKDAKSSDSTSKDAKSTDTKSDKGTGAASTTSTPAATPSPSTGSSGAASS